MKSAKEMLQIMDIDFQNRMKILCDTIEETFIKNSKNDSIDRYKIILYRLNKLQISNNYFTKKEQEHVITEFKKLGYTLSFERLTEGDYRDTYESGYMSITIKIDQTNT